MKMYYLLFFLLLSGVANADEQLIGKCVVTNTFAEKMKNRIFGFVDAKSIIYKVEDRKEKNSLIADIVSLISKEMANSLTKKQQYFLSYKGTIKHKLIRINKKKVTIKPEYINDYYADGLGAIIGIPKDDKWRSRLNIQGKDEWKVNKVEAQRKIFSKTISVGEEFDYFKVVPCS